MNKNTKTVTEQERAESKEIKRLFALIRKRLASIKENTLSIECLRRIEKLSSGTLCSHCWKEDAEPDHTCPYRAEINDDETTLCDCCVTCREQCAGDV